MEPDLIPCPECGEETEVSPGDVVRCGLCGATVESPENLWANGPADTAPAFRREAAVERIGREMDDINARRKKYNLLSFALALPGFVLSIGGQVALRMQDAPPLGAAPADPDPVVLLGALAAAGMGVLMLIAGFGCYAVYKGRSPAWGLLGLLSWIGLIGLALLPDHNKKRLKELTDKLERLSVR